MRVLYLSHTATVSGAEHLLLDLLPALPAELQPLAAAPAGELLIELDRRGVPVVEVPGTAGSLTPHPVHTPRTLAEMAAASWAVAGVVRRFGIDLVHANSIRAGLIAAPLARVPGRPSVLVHVHDALPPSAMTSAVLGALSGSGVALLANSEYTANRLPSPRRRTRVLPNPVDLKRFDPASADGSEFRREFGVGADPFLVGVIAQITPWKGQDVAIEVVRLLRERGHDVRLAIVGAPKFVAKTTRYDNLAYLERLKTAARAATVAGSVHLTGDRADIPAVLASLDALLVPSWEEPFGRIVIEGMAMGVPVIATRVGGPAEIIHDGHDGVLLAPREPTAWADAVEAMMENADDTRTMAANGRRTAERDYGLHDHLKQLEALYRDLLPNGGKP